MRRLQETVSVLVVIVSRRASREERVERRSQAGLVVVSRKGDRRGGLTVLVEMLEGLVGRQTLMVAGTAGGQY
jgi:hypothetical protein